MNLGPPTLEVGEGSLKGRVPFTPQLQEERGVAGRRGRHNEFCDGGASWVACSNLLQGCVRISHCSFQPFPVAQAPPAVQEAWIQSLAREDPQEEDMATHASVLMGKTPWTERSLAGYGPWGHKESDTTEVTEHAHTAVFSLNVPFTIICNSLLISSQTLCFM